jgi:hypothetical protein
VFWFCQKAKKRRRRELGRVYRFLEVKPSNWPAPGSEDTELGVLMELEVCHGETEVYPRVQA